MLQCLRPIMRLFLIQTNKMISLRKRGNGRFSTSDYVCVDGITKVTLRSKSLLISAIKYFLLGNPFNVWSSTASIGVFAIVAAIYILRWQRHYVDFTPAYIDHVHYAGLYPLLAWGLHYVPFFIMGRFVRFVWIRLISVYCTSIITFQHCTLQF